MTVGIVVVAVAAGIATGVAVSGDTGDHDAPAAPPLTTTTTTVPAGHATRGAPDLDDPYFPGLGNGGYDVAHYDLDLAWTPTTERIDGVVTIEAVATQWLSAFDLDLVGLEVEEVTVDGRAAEAFPSGERELVITPPEPIRPDTAFTVEVTYGGVPEPLATRARTFEPGWVADGREVHVIGQPDGAATFFPVNDHPQDKATYTIEVTVPRDLDVAANGTFVDATGDGRATTWSYEVDEPMASYLVQVVIGNLRFEESEGPDGLPIRHAFDEDVPRSALTAVDATTEMIDYFVEFFGPYPFGSYGVAVVDEPLGLAMESQTLPLFGTDAIGLEAVLAHELAHQWFGNHVSPATWQEVWLSEGFATYAQWLWAEASGGPSVTDQATFAAGAGGDDLGLPPGDPGPGNLFADSVYVRGALTLHALRHEIGDEAFFALLRAWVQRYGGRTATTADFVALAHQHARRDVSELFDAWLRDDGMPPLDEWVG